MIKPILTRTALFAALLAAVTLAAPAGGQSATKSEDAAAAPDVGSPECAWVGQRILMLLWRDDIHTTNAFFQIYDRFGCPMGHTGPAFRCLVQIGVNPEEADPGLPQRARACWDDPGLDPTSFLPPEEGGGEQEGEPAPQ